MAAPLSLRASIEALEPDPRRRGSVRQALRCIRWHDGVQGVGPLSTRMLTRTLGAGARVRAALPAAGLGDATTSVVAAWRSLGMPTGGGVTRQPARPLRVGEAVRRCTGAAARSIRFLSLNTYLLPGFKIPPDGTSLDVLGDVLELFGAEFPQIAIGAKPALEARAAATGRLLHNYDLACLCEVFDDATRGRILVAAGGADPGEDGFGAVPGPDRMGDLTFIGSGLFLLHRQRWPVVRREAMVFENRGQREQDSDAWSSKGALFVGLDLGMGELEVFQTHLHYGGGLPAPFAEPTAGERAAGRRDELGELARFFQAHHRQGNVSILTGDFNMDGADARDYADIRRALDLVGLQDMWARDVYGHDPAGGATCRFTDGDEGGWERSFDRICRPPRPGEGQTACESPVPPPAKRAGVGRFDYVFVSRPTDNDRYTLEVSRPLLRRFPLPRPTDGETFVSDHLGIEMTLLIAPR